MEGVKLCVVFVFVLAASLPFTVFFCSIKNRANMQTSERPNDDRTMVDPVVAPDPPECMDAHWQASTYAQFCLDVPRMKLVVDGVHDAGLNPTCAYAWLGVACA